MGVIIVGAGGHAKVIADCLLRQGTLVAGFVDDSAALWGKKRFALPILGSVADVMTFEPDGVILGIGDNRTRKKLAEQSPDNPWTNAIHPSAIIAPSVKLGVGVVIAAGAIINPDVVIGDHVIINTGATVDHDCMIADYAHIAPGAILTGGVQVGTGSWVKAAVSFVPYLIVGNWAIVETGSVVTRDIPNHVVASGIPARWAAD